MHADVSSPNSAHRAFCGLDDDAVRVVCAEPPRSAPSQPLFDFCAAFDRGLFVTSAIMGTPPAAADLRGGGEEGAACGVVLAAPRTGVKPARICWIALLTRGVLPTISWLGTLSAVNICGGTLSQSSKSSGARRLTPIVDPDDEARR